MVVSEANLCPTGLHDPHLPAPGAGIDPGKLSRCASTPYSAVAKTLDATKYGVGGEAPAFYDISAISDSDLARVVPVAIVVIGVLLCLVMRSLIAPLYLIASVALSFLAALGLSVILFIKIGGDSGLTFILPFLMFIFLLALGEDYNILVMSRIREEAHHLPLREAVSRALGATGTTVTSAGLVLAGTFAVFALVGGRGSGWQPDPRHRGGPSARRADGHVHRPHRPGAVHSHPARPVELVAVRASRRAAPCAFHGGASPPGRRWMQSGRAGRARRCAGRPGRCAAARRGPRG